MSSNFWKFYCWIYGAISVPVALGEVSNIDKWRFIDYLFVPLLIVGFLVLYSYAYKARIFSQKVWQVVWWYNIVWLSITILYSYPYFVDYYPDSLKSYYYFEYQPPSDEFSMLIMGVIFVAGMIPLYYANYVIAFDQKYLTRKKSID